MPEVTVLYFAALRERLGRAEESLDLPADATVAELLAALRARHPTLAALRGFRVAVNQEFADEGDPVPAGAEVALIPPVAGGAPPAPPRVTTRLTADPISADALAAEIAHPGAGAQAVFLGVVRDAHRGREVARMDYEAYEGMAAAELARVAADLIEAHPAALRVSLVHRFGRLEIGEASVGVAVAAAHRKEAFRACEWGLDEIKARVPIWKKEHYLEGDHHWVRADEMGAADEAGTG